MKISKLITKRGAKYEVSADTPYDSIVDHDMVFVVTTKYQTRIRIFSDAVESVEYENIP